MGSRFGPQGLAGRFSLGFFLISGLVAASCVNRDGETLPPGLMTFPIAIELSQPPAEGEPADFVFVANSNFALQFNTGTLQSYSLQVLNDAIDSTGDFEGLGCVGSGFLDICVERDATNGILETCIPPGTQTGGCDCDPDVEPGCVSCTCDIASGPQCDPVPADRCSVIPEQLRLRDQGALLKTIVAPGLLLSEAEIGSFADGMALSSEGNRLYLPVRSNANLTFVDIDDQGLLDCGSGFVENQSCSEFYRTGGSAQANPDFFVDFPPDPVDVIAGDLAEAFAPPGREDDPAYQGDYIVVAHREGEASLLLDQDIDGSMRPRIVAAVDELAPEQVTLAYEPAAKTAWITSALSNQVVRVGIGIDGDPIQSNLFDAGPLLVTGIDTGNSMRDIQFDPRPGVDLAYLVSRTPQALVVARRDVGGDDLNVLDEITICRGPSRLQLVELPARGGTVLTAFISCFDQRMVAIVDVDLLQPITILTNISGSFEFVVDVPRRRIYIADFSTSVIRVADISPLLDCLEVPDTGAGGAGGMAGAGGDGGQGGAGGTGGTRQVRECAPQLIGLVGLPQPVSEFPR